MAGFLSRFWYYSATLVPQHGPFVLSQLAGTWSFPGQYLAGLWSHQRQCEKKIANISSHRIRPKRKSVADRKREKGVADGENSGWRLGGKRSALPSLTPYHCQLHLTSSILSLSSSSSHLPSNPRFPHPHNCGGREMRTCALFSQPHLLGFYLYASFPPNFPLPPPLSPLLQRCQISLHTLVVLLPSNEK